jgi:hypothetical protein
MDSGDDSNDELLEDAVADVIGDGGNPTLCPPS